MEQEVSPSEAAAGSQALQGTLYQALSSWGHATRAA
ncbi:hypothetical protein HaLaN_15277 [Haematococcus lacustris]|uniref:Uncharacterized protein n=1 Tax=Haematococcus lacustris TaxID=44745 RepID=A0A699ZA00_HAELA|nr:hypothetical protein HaLaN_15277 [Haematococcus lacustris]